MVLELKPDADRVFDWFDAWWCREPLPRPLVSLAVPKRESAPPAPAPPADLRDRWLDQEYWVEAGEARLRRHEYVAETLPVLYPNVGPELCGALFGCELEFSEDSSWSVPFLESLADVFEIAPNWDNVYWQTTMQGLHLSLERGAGKWLTGIADLHVNADLLCSLRDPENLALDCADDLDLVRRATDHVDAFFPEIYRRLADPILAAGQPTLTWLPATCRGRMYVPSCDFACLVSGADFDEAFLPAIEREVAFLDRSIFHLDGPGALRHLDSVLAIPGLDALQWVYGAGSGPASRWLDVYREAQARGKAVMVLAESLEDARACSEALRPEGLWLSIEGEYDRETAEAFVASLEPGR